MVSKFETFHTVLLTIVCIFNPGICSTNSITDAVPVGLNGANLSNASVFSSSSLVVSNRQTFSQSARNLSRTHGNSSQSASNLSTTEFSVTWKQSKTYRIPYLAPDESPYWRPWMTVMFGLMAVLLCFAVACILYFTNKQNTLGKVEPSKLNVDESFWNVPDGPTPPSADLVPKKKSAKKNISPIAPPNLPLVDAATNQSAMKTSTDTMTPTNILHSPPTTSSANGTSLNSHPIQPLLQVDKQTSAHESSGSSGSETYVTQTSTD